jgi:hypothetical protein
MKRILFFLVALSVTYVSYSQSTIIEPGRNQLESTASDNLTIRSNSSLLGIQGIRFKGTIIAKTPVLANDDLLRIGGGGNSTTSSENFDKALIRLRASQNWNTTNMGTKIQFSTTQNNGTTLSERMVIDHNGNVGIGVISPATQLHINEPSVGVASSFQLTNADAGAAISDGLHFSLNPSGLFSFGASIINKENSFLTFGANNLSNQLFLDPNGNVGINSLQPLGRMQIDHLSSSSSNPHLRLRTTNDVNATRIRAENSTGTRFFEQRFYTGSSFAGSNYIDINYGNDNLLTVTGDGKFGINNVSPADLLHLKPISNTGDVYARLSTSTGLSGLRLQNNTGDWSMYTNEFSKLFFGYSSNNFGTTDQVLILEPNATEFNFIPSTTNQVYLGTSGSRWREIWSQNPLNTSSDRRLKKNIVEIKYGLDEIMKLQAVSYNWKNNNDSKLQLGFIAQDVEKIVPEIVSKSGISDEEFAKLEQKGETISDTYGMQYTGLIPVLVKAVQEQQNIIESKSKEIIQLSQKLQKMEELEARLSSIESLLEGKKPSQGLKTEK